MTFQEYAMQGWNFEGLSSKCIYGFYSGHVVKLNYPHDPDDLCRCIQVLRLLFKDNEQRKAELLNQIGEKYKSKQYLALAENWHELMRIFKEEWNYETAPKTYNFMERIYGIQNPDTKRKE